ncbi:response regulator [Candidatus Contubernalis alkaliaceticus]|uniref:response regulator n=1 Tax=Candidatus Contubernalis alkaliaceticus TaxID=338645 RepID=UPI001F4BF819|nr:response regulator transcription factor [Candidatus Contubernalis alkalaceticus]UNC91176.1 response regulator transcription factor [Candidatus Contubernalis alkalaceticus]
MTRIRILIVDDQTLMREGLSTILELESDFLIAGTAANGQEAVKFCLEKPPDVVLMDIRMPQMDGVEATRRITAAHPSVKIIILTTFLEDDLIVKGLKAGAKTYLLKDLPSEKLAESIRAIYRGDIFMQPEIAARLVAQAAGQLPAGELHEKYDTLIEPLTRRELNILALMAEGLSNSAIASQLHLSEGTVKNHVSSIYGKLGISDRTQAVLFALKHRLI